jgi:hypothetical protein
VSIIVIQVFAFTRLSTDADALFEFFAARLANLAGARYVYTHTAYNNRHNYNAYTHIYSYNAYYYDTPRANLNNQLASNGAGITIIDTITQCILHIHTYTHILILHTTPIIMI